jgi:hypothetical protein
MARTSKLVAAAIAVAAIVTASPTLGATRHNFQLKNCNPYANMWGWWIYNAEDSVEFQPYMTINFSSVGQTKSGKCKGSGDGYCKAFQPTTQSQFHVKSSATVYGDAGHFRHYSGLLDCNNEPPH